MKFANHHGYSDCHPFEVIREVSDKCMEIRKMDAVQIGFPKRFIMGGFSAHCEDNYAQEWECSSNEEYPIIRIRWSKAKKRWQDRHGRHFILSDRPVRFHDYNF